MTEDNWFQSNVWVIEWLVIFGIFAAVITAIVAMADYNRKKKIERKEQQRVIRDCISEVQNHLRTLRREAESGSLEKTTQFDDALDEIIGKLKGIGDNLEQTISLSGLIAAQFFWLKDLSKEVEWIRNVHCSIGGEDKEWVNGVMNSMLDVVKDYVLDNSDFDYLQKDFWEEAATPYLNEGYEKEIPLNPTADDYERARSRWIEKAQWQNMRIRALVDYKVKAEHSLAFFLRANFSDSKMNEMPRSEKFALSVKHIWSELFAELYEQLDALANKNNRSK